jgi:hypothetical protein
MRRLALRELRSVRMSGGFVQFGVLAAFAIAVAALIIFVLV